MKGLHRILKGWILPLVLCLVAVPIVLFNEQVGRIEGRLLPVVSAFERSEISHVLGGFEMAGGAKKLRNCDWRKTVFSLGARNGGSIILTDDPHRDPPTVNGLGWIGWNRIFVPLSVHRANEAFADVYHQCGWRPWLTITRFYN